MCVCVCVCVCMCVCANCLKSVTINLFTTRIGTHLDSL